MTGWLMGYRSFGGNKYGKSATWGVVQTPGTPGLVGLAGLETPSPETKGEGDNVFYRGENNPTNPNNPKIESNGTGHASQTGGSGEERVTQDSLFTPPAKPQDGSGADALEM